MTIQDLLLKRNLIENINYSFEPDEDGVVTIVPILSYKFELQDQLDASGISTGKALAKVEYTPEIPSIQSLMAEIKIKEALNAQELGAKIIAEVYAINERNQISNEKFSNLLNDSNIARIERLLWSGSLKTAKALISLLDDTYFTAEEKQSILDMLQEY